MNSISWDRTTECSIFTSFFLQFALNSNKIPLSIQNKMFYTNFVYFVKEKSAFFIVLPEKSNIIFNKNSAYAIAMRTSSRNFNFHSLPRVNKITCADAVIWLAIFCLALLKQVKQILNYTVEKRGREFELSLVGWFWPVEKKQNIAYRPVLASSVSSLLLYCDFLNKFHDITRK